MNLDGFVGCSYVQTPQEISAEDAVNLYPEAQEVPNKKNPVILRGSPGTRAYMTLGNGPIRGILNTEDFTDVISGSDYYRIDPGGVATLVGTVANDGKPAKLVASITQLAIASAGTLYVSDGGGFSAVAGPWTFAADVEFLDGYFIVLDDDGLPVGGQFFISALNDARTWDPLDFSNAPSSNNKLRAIHTDHEELWIFGSVVTQVFYYNGNADFPFVPNQTGILQQGIGAKDTLQQLDNTLFWVGQNKDGTLQAFVADGYRPQRISTHAIEQQWARYSTTSDAIAWTYQIAGHPTYHVNFPTAQKSWRYDRATNLWHRAMFRNPSSNVEECHRGNCHAVRLGLHIIGDRETGDLWEFTPEVNADGDNPLLAYRIAPGVWAGNKMVFYKLFELITPGGIGDGTSSTPEEDPEWLLSWSNDNGHNFGVEYSLVAGRQGDYSTRLRKVACGAGRNRIFKVAISANVPRCLIGAEVEVEVGKS